MWNLVTCGIWHRHELAVRCFSILWKLVSSTHQYCPRRTLRCMRMSMSMSILNALRVLIVTFCPLRCVTANKFQYYCICAAASILCCCACVDVYMWYYIVVCDYHDSHVVLYSSVRLSWFACRHIIFCWWCIYIKTCITYAYICTLYVQTNTY